MAPSKAPIPQMPLHLDGAEAQMTWGCWTDPLLSKLGLVHPQDFISGGFQEAEMDDCLEKLLLMLNNNIGVQTWQTWQGEFQCWDR